MAERYKNSARVATLLVKKMHFPGVPYGSAAQDDDKQGRWRVSDQASER